LTAPNPFALDEDPDDSVETPPNTNDGSALRKWAKAQADMVKQLQKELADTKAENAARAMADVFKELGVPDKVRKFYSGDPTKEAITQWVQENADVFGLAGPDGEDPTVPPERRQQFDDLSGVMSAQSLGQDKDGAVSREVLAQQRAELMAKKNSGISDLDAALAAIGVPNSPLMAPQF
jgi:hypothetical protein